MTNNPMYPLYSTTTPVDLRQQRLDAICDQCRYLLLDWIEYAEKKGVNLTFQQYVEQWQTLFSAISEKMAEVAE